MQLRSGISVIVIEASAAAPIQPLAPELPYATGVAKERGRVGRRKEEKGKGSIEGRRFSSTLKKMARSGSGAMRMHLADPLLQRACLTRGPSAGL